MQAASSRKNIILQHQIPHASHVGAVISKSEDLLCFCNNLHWKLLYKKTVCFVHIAMFLQACVVVKQLAATLVSYVVAELDNGGEIHIKNHQETYGSYMDL